MRSRSEWSMIAMSSGVSRRTRCFVRLPSRAVPRTSGTSEANGERPVVAGSRVVVLDTARGRSLRGLKELFGVSPGRLVALVGAEHAAQLLDQLRAPEPLDLGPGDRRRLRVVRGVAQGGVLGDAEMACREGRHLRQMSDADD